MDRTSFVVVFVALACASSLRAQIADPPPLTLIYQNGQPIVSWPLASAGWTLEQSPELDPSKPWTPLASYQTNGASILYSVPQCAQAMFFRLAPARPSIVSVPGLTAAWTFDEGQCTSAVDASGNQNDAVLSNVSWTTGRVGYGALRFNGQAVDAGGSRLVMTNTNYRVLPPSGSPFTLSFWFSPEALPIGWSGLAGNDVDANGWHLALHTSGPGTNEIVFTSAGNGGFDLTGRKLLLPGQWYELVATCDGSEAAIYLDSQLLARAPGSIQSGTNPIIQQSTNPLAPAGPPIQSSNNPFTETSTNPLLLDSVSATNPLIQQSTNPVGVASVSDTNPTIQSSIHPFLVGSVSGTNPLIQQSNNPLMVGAGISNYPSFLGRIDELRTYSIALSHEQISLAGIWHMDETNGVSLIDSGIRGHHGTVSSTEARVPGKQGSGINLSNNTVVIGNSFADLLPPTGGGFSLSFWIRPDALSNDWSGLMNCDSLGHHGWRLALRGNGAGDAQLRFWSTDSEGTLDLNAPLNLPIGSWNKLDLTFNGGIATLYLNGRKVASDNGGIQGSTAPLVLGSVIDMPNFNGAIDELKIYRRERDESEIGPVAKIMWETVLRNTSSNLVLQGFGPAAKPLTFALANTVSPSNGTVTLLPGTTAVTYTAGNRKGPDAFAYTVSDGEFTTAPTSVVISVVEPHWLTPDGGATPPLDGSSPDHAWLGGPSEALDAIWKTNNYYDCFFYAPGEYQTSGSHRLRRRSAFPGCKHIGTGSEGLTSTTLKLVNLMETYNEEFIFGGWELGPLSDGFEVRDMLLDCNARNNPKYVVGEPVSIRIPLANTSRVDSIVLHWGNTGFNGWLLGHPRKFTVSLRIPATGEFVTNQSSIISSGPVDSVPIGVETDEILLQLEERLPGVAFYSLAEVEINGGAVSLPTATTLDGLESRLSSAHGSYSIMQAADSDNTTAWASGPEDSVQIVLPLRGVSSISQLNIAWKCQLTNVGRFGPAMNYEIRARNSQTGELLQVPFLRQPRTTLGLEVNTFSNPLFTDQLVLLLNSKELGVDFYSIRELTVFSGPNVVALRMPTSSGSLLWGSYQIGRAFDQDPATVWASDTQGMVGAIDTAGSNMKLTGLRIIGFGTKATRECFPVVLHTPQPWAPVAHLGNVLVENCVFTDPAADNTDGLSALSVLGVPPHSLTNAVVRHCVVTNVASRFRYSHAFTATHVENSFVGDCNVGVYFEPNPLWGDDVGGILVRSNSFFNVDYGVALLFAPAAQFDSVTCIANEVLLTGAGGWAFGNCDTCSGGVSGSTTNVTLLNNLVRYPGWLRRPASPDGGLYSSDIHKAVFGNNIVALGASGALRLRACPSGFIPPKPPETCDGDPVPTTIGTYATCLDVLPSGYRRSLFNNRDITGDLLGVRHFNDGVDGYATQQQWK